MTNLDIIKEEYPDKAFLFIQSTHKAWSERSKELFSLAENSLNGRDYFEELWDEASSLEWKAYEFALDNQKFIQQYKSEHPEITYKFFDDDLRHT